MRDSTIYLYCETEPVIEESDELTFGPYNLAYPSLDQQVESAGFNAEENRWMLVFNARKGGANLYEIDPSIFEPFELEVEGVDDFPSNPFPVPKRFGGLIEDNAHESWGAPKSAPKPGKSRLTSFYFQFLISKVG